MPDNTEKNDSLESQEPIDLSALAGLTFGPSWSDPKTSIRSPRVERREEERSSRGEFQKGRSGGGQRDRRPAMDRTNRRMDDRGQGRDFQEVFQPTVEIAFYPEDDPFLALIKAIRVSCKTYELFELARLILEKPERFVAVIHGKRTDKNPLAKLYVCPFDGMPFESEDEALKYTLKNHIGNFFDVEEIEVEPPKGSFPVINKCGITGELLGPPNYHRYQDFLREHYANNLSNVSYEKFLSKIESVKDEEVVRAWSEKMSKGKRYTFKKVGEGEEKPVFNTWEDARLFLLSRHKAELVQEVNSVRFHGSLMAQMPRGDIRRSFEVLLKMQRDFPLDTANNIRGRLRRMNLAIYKKGSKGITYVCAVKRRFRQEGISFAENLQALVDFIEKHPNCSVSKLPELYLGIQQAAKETSKDPEAEPAVSLTSEQQSQIRKLMLDLRWLVSEGYVTEYGNATLYAAPPVSSAKAVEKQSVDGGEESVETEEVQVPLEYVQAGEVVEESIEAKVVSEKPEVKKAKKAATKKAPEKKKATKKAKAKEEVSSIEESAAAAE